MSANHSTAKPDTSLDIIIELLACMTQADGIVHKSENETAELILSQIAPDELSKIKDLYRSAVRFYTTDDRKNNIYKLIKTLPVEQKLSVLRTLWALALSDGKIHSKESEMVSELMRLCQIDNNMVTLGAAGIAKATVQ